MSEKIFLNDRLIQIDVDIPIAMMFVGDSQERAHHLYKAWDILKVKMNNHELFGGINVPISKQFISNHLNCSAFMVVEMGQLHHETKKMSGNYSHTGEMGIKLLNTGWGEDLERHFCSGGVERTDYFLRGSLDLLERGEIESVEFTEVTALLPKYSNYTDDIMQQIFNPELLAYCPYETREKFEKKRYPFHKHGNTYSEPIQFKGDIQEY